MTLNRRKFLGSAAVAAGAPAILSQTLRAVEPKGDWTITIEEAAAKIKAVYPLPATRRQRVLPGQIYQQCVLGKIRPPGTVVKHRWLAPGGCYQAQWIWDTMFVVDLLSILPDQRENDRRGVSELLGLPGPMER